jgi:hypothetical protein
MAKRPKGNNPNLDLHFGLAIPPKRMDPIEFKVQPLSLERLTSRTAELLKQLMVVAEHGLGVARFAYAVVPILWVIDTKGTLWFALEELIEIDTGKFLFPRVRDAPVDTKHQRLGHPALVKGANGRIAGEIFFDIRADVPAWVITNGSGRYGTREGRTATQLSNVSQQFAQHGIRLREKFLEIK